MKRSYFYDSQLGDWLLEIMQPEDILRYSPHRLIQKTNFYMDALLVPDLPPKKRTHKQLSKELCKENPVKFFIECDPRFLDDCLLSTEDKEKWMTRERFLQLSEEIYHGTLQVIDCPALVVVGIEH